MPFIVLKGVSRRRCLSYEWTSRLSNFIAVNAEKLENCLTTLTLSIQCLQSYSTLEHV